MAVSTTTTKLIQLRSICLPSTTGSLSIKFFSSSSGTHDPNEDTSPNTHSTDSPPPKSSSSFSSSLGDLKATLKQPQGNLQSRTPRTSFSFESSSPTARHSFDLSHKEEIIRNLSEFRRRSAVNPPPASHGSATQPGDHISLAQMYQDTVASRGEESSSGSSKSLGSTSLKSISESLQRIEAINVNNPSERFAKNNDSLSLSRFRETLKLKPGDMSGRHPTKLIGGSDNLPLSVFGKEMEEGNRASANADTGEEFLKIYSHMDLGEKLKSLRPDIKGDWFSLQELNDRLMKLRQIDKENVSDPRHVLYGTLRSSLINIDKANKQKKPMPNLDILRHLGRSPSFMMLPPQEHLIEKYFHPDNMSASEKLKLELEKVRDEFKMSESDCGSARVQVAQLTTKIKHLATVLHKKDKHSRKGLLGMVQKRKTLLKYLRRTDWESYCFVLSKLGLRDNPDYKN